MTDNEFIELVCKSCLPTTYDSESCIYKDNYFNNTCSIDYKNCGTFRYDCEKYQCGNLDLCKRKYEEGYFAGVIKTRGELRV